METKKANTKSLSINIVKTLILFPAALYLFGFSLNGVNFYGSIDAFIPIERAIAFVVSMCLFGMFTASIHKIIIGCTEK